MGGALAESIGWRWAFGIQVAPLLICAGISWVTIPRDIGIQDKRGASLWQILKAFDSKGSLLLTTAVTFFILGLVSFLLGFNIQL
jgi:predicted MFS family arabinose efflux permease